MQPNPSELKTKELRMELEEFGVGLNGTEPRKLLEALLEAARIGKKYGEKSKCFGLLYDLDFKGQATNPYPCRVCFEADKCKVMTSHNETLGKVKRETPVIVEPHKPKVEVPVQITQEASGIESMLMIIGFRESSSLYKVAQMILKDNGKITREQLITCVMGDFSITRNNAYQKYYAAIGRMKKCRFNVVVDPVGHILVDVKQT